MKNAEINNAIKNNQQKSTRFHYLILVLLIILASIERIYGIDRQSLWSDELYAVMASYKNHFTNIWPLLVNDSHPPGYVAFMYWALPWFGYSDIGIRLHSLIYGILWIPLVYWIGKRWFSHNIGLFAATIITSSYSAIYFSQEARAYSMLVAFNLANLICFLEILFSKKCHRGYVQGFIVSSVIALYLHYAGFVFFAAEGLLYVLFWVSRYRKGSLLEIAKIFGIPLLIYAPWMGLMFNHLTDTSRLWAVTAKPTLDDVYYAFLYLWGFNHHLLKAYLCSLVIVISWTTYRHIKQGLSRQGAVVYTLVFMLVIPALAFYIESIFWTPIFERRYILITVPLIALIIAMVAAQIFQFLVSPPWKTLSLVALIVLFTAWRIDSNIQQKLYSQETKENSRHAVNVIKQDVNANKTSEKFFVLMSHNWFEHYLRQAKLPVDARVTYDAADQLHKVSVYLNNNPDIRYFYYLSFRQATSATTNAALMQQYKLLSTVEIPHLNGAIDVFKLSVNAVPDLDQAGRTINEVGRQMALNTLKKKTNRYAILMSHNQIESPLRRYGVPFDEKWAGRQYAFDVQIEEISRYLRAHDAVESLYYLVLRQPQTAAAIDMLSLQYQMLSKVAVETEIGTIDIYTFNPKARPNYSSTLKEKMNDNNPANKAAMLVKKYIGNNKSNRYAVIMTHSWFQPYLHVQGVKVDEGWEGLTHIADFQSERVFTYVNQHPEVNHLYYLALRDGNPENGLLPLLLKYQLVSHDTLESPVGKLEVFHFKTNVKKFSVPTTFEAEFAKSPAHIAANSIAKQIGRAKPDRYIVLTSHQWFNLYLRKVGLDVDREWPGHLLYADTQVEEVFKYMAAHPTISNLYYMAYRETNNDRAAEKLQARYRLMSKNTIKTMTSQIDIYRFDTKISTAH